MKTGRIKRDESRLLNFWVPETLVNGMDEAVRLLDTDRSKFIRNAIREKIEALTGGSSRGAAISQRGRAAAAAVAISALLAGMALSAHAPECSDDQGTLPVMATSAE